MTADDRREHLFDSADFKKAEKEILGARKTCIELLEEFIQIPSVNPPGEFYLECALLLAERLRDLGFEPRLVNVPKHELQRLGLPTDQPRPAVLTALGVEDESAPTLHFHGHYDVVPADSSALFRLRLKGDDAYGRGTADMKGGIVAMFLALHALRDHARRLRGRILLSLVPDEETGGAAGTAHLFRAGALAPNGIGMLTPEPTSGVIWNGNRGALSQLLTLHGEMAHVALQHTGRNAFEGMLKLGVMLHELKEKIEARSFDPEQTILDGPASVLLLGGICRGGTNFNVVPESVRFSVDRRFHPHESPKEVRRELEAIYRRVRAEGWTLKVQNLQEGDASLTPADTPLSRTMAEVVGSVTGEQPPLTLCPGILETRFFLKENTPGLAYGPGALEVSHTNDERVSIGKILECARIYARMACALLT